MPILRPTIKSSPNWTNPTNAVDGNESTCAKVTTKHDNYSDRVLTLNLDFSSIIGRTISSMTLHVRAKCGVNTVTMYVDINGNSKDRVIEKTPNTKDKMGILYTVNINKYIPSVSTISNITVTSYNSKRLSENTLDLFEIYIEYELKKYTVRFLDWNGNVLSSQSVAEGDSATPPSNPSRDGYAFDGWDKSYENINSDTDITAIYKKLYTVRFLGLNGNELSSQLVQEGTSATPPNNTNIPGYTFTGWDTDFSNVTSDLTVTAQYTINKYTVTFKDWNGTILKEEQNVTHGSSATPPSNPSKEGHTFTGWDKSFSNVTSNLVVTAQYEINKYTVTFVYWNNGTTVSEEQTVNYGSGAIAPSIPSKEGHTFDRWDTDFSSVKSNLTITAIYTKNTYTVTFIYWNNGTVSNTQTVEYGSQATPPNIPSREGYTFTGWNPSNFSNITGDLTVTAQYAINTYTVIFKDYDGTILKEEQIVEYGSDAIPPNNPSREGYTFTGWDTVFSNVKSNLVVTATYIENTASINKILIGDTTTDNLYVGDSNVIAVYIGDFLVFGIDISE